MTDLEKKIKAKIPGEDTGIEVKHAMCSICSPGMHCGVDCYVKDGRIIKVEGMESHPWNKGKICVKGQSGRDYVYREDRIKTPLKRVGARGEGRFEPISWDEAIALIAENLNKVKAEYGPESVMFLSGYCKWYRPWLHRMAHVFCTPNFGTDDCNCSAAMVVANKCTSGTGGGADFGKCNTFFGWNYDGYYSNHMNVASVKGVKKRGGKVIIIDIRETPAVKNLADIFVQINPGTDGALALGMANEIIKNGWEDKEYVEKYTHGFEQYKALCAEYDLDKVEAITGVSKDMVKELARLYACEGPTACNYSASALVHHINGFNAHRAVLCLSALTGNFDRAGGQVPVPATYLHKSAGFSTREAEFRSSADPRKTNPDCKRILGADRFPLWEEKFDETQTMDLLRQLTTDEPYPIRAIYAHGMNVKMYPESDNLARAMAEKLDFFVLTDLFMTYTAKWADLVLPACSSFERSEIKCYAGGYAVFTEPVIQPLYESRSDVDIIYDVYHALGLKDELMDLGYEGSIDWMFDGCGTCVSELKKGHNMPLKVPNAKWPIAPGKQLENGFKTPTGKFEFYSESIAKVDRKYGLDPLPVYYDSLADEPDPEGRYPYYLCTGARMSISLHSRVHEVPYLRQLRKHPMCEVNMEDMKALGLKDGDDVVLYSPHGEITVKVHGTFKIKPGVILMLHGYSEANVNLLEGRDHLDPYSGYPGHKGMRCNIRKEVK
ncbi:MAG: molybdopterin-dependent oxidoreductase [Lachnospiraceae bacterium]|nr:molybdopterin-dependent oxidoreductase [Lachnospiraceae bacterium]